MLSSNQKSSEFLLTRGTVKIGQNSKDENPLEFLSWNPVTITANRRVMNSVDHRFSNLILGAAAPSQGRPPDLLPLLLPRKKKRCLENNRRPSFIPPTAPASKTVIFPVLS